MTDEQFLPVAGYEASYEIGDRGTFRSLTRVVHRDHVGQLPIVGRVIKPTTMPNGYLVVRMSADGVVKAEYVHRLVAAAFLGTSREIDHIDRDRANNARENLRPCDRRLNMGNMPKKAGSSQFKGVSFQKSAKKWTAQIKENGRKNHLGCFDQEADAARAYDMAARRVFGEFARCNFVGHGGG